MTSDFDQHSLGNVTLGSRDLQTVRRLVGELVVALAGGGNEGMLRTKSRRYDLAIRLVEAREARTSHLPGVPLGEPIWDILLHLYCAEGSNQLVDAHTLDRSIRTPRSTIERWVGHLVECNMVECFDAGTKVGAGVRLSRDGLAKLDAYFSALLEEQFEA